MRLDVNFARRRNRSMIRDLCRSDAMLAHDWYDIFKKRIDRWLLKRVCVGVTFKRDTHAKRIAIGSALPSTFASVPCALRWTRKHSPASIACNYAMV